MSGKIWRFHPHFQLVTSSVGRRALSSEDTTDHWPGGKLVHQRYPTRVIFKNRNVAPPSCSLVHQSQSNIETSDIKLYLLINSQQRICWVSISGAGDWWHENARPEKPEQSWNLAGTFRCWGCKAGLINFMPGWRTFAPLAPFIFSLCEWFGHSSGYQKNFPDTGNQLQYPWRTILRWCPKQAMRIWTIHKQS